MMRVLQLLLAGFLLFNASVYSAQPAHARAKNLGLAELSKSTTGQELLAQASENDVGEILFHCFNTKSVGTTDYDVFCKRPYFVKDNRPIFNAAFISADPIYFSWIMAMGLAHYNISKRLPSLVKYNLVEFEVYAWAEAMKYFIEIGAPTNVDYADHSDFDYARVNQLSSKEFAAAWENGGDIFFYRVRERYETLNWGEYLRVEDLEARALTSKERDDLRVLRTLLPLSFR